MSERIPPLMATERHMLSERALPLDRTSLNLVQHAVAYAIQQSQEPNEAEIETVARAIAVAAAKTPNYWTWYNDMARAAIRAIRGLDAEATP